MYELLEDLNNLNRMEKDYCERIEKIVHTVKEIEGFINKRYFEVTGKNNSLSMLDSCEALARRGFNYWGIYDEYAKARASVNVYIETVSIIRYGFNDD